MPGPERKTVHAAMLRVTPGLFKAALHLPEGWEVRRIRISADSFDDALLIVVEGDDLPETSVGDKLHELFGRYTQNSDGTISFEWEIAGAQPVREARTVDVIEMPAATRK